MLPFGCKNIEEFVKKWNNICPIDKWYRKKYNIPFNSKRHRDISLIDMYIEYIEFLNEHKNKDNIVEEEYIKGKGNFIKSPLSSKYDLDKAFDELDIDSIT